KNRGRNPGQTPWRAGRDCIHHFLDCVGRRRLRYWLRLFTERRLAYGLTTGIVVRGGACPPRPCCRSERCLTSIVRLEGACIALQYNYDKRTAADVILVFRTIMNISLANMRSLFLRLN